MPRDVERTDDGRFVVVDGRRWRTADPALPADVRERLLHHLGVGRSGVRAGRRGDDDAAVAAARARVQLAKTGLGERGPACGRTSLPPTARELAAGPCREAVGAGGSSTGGGGVLHGHQQTTRTSGGAPGGGMIAAWLGRRSRRHR